MKHIDLNCDMGESFGAWKMGDDAAIMPLITSANIAAGFHAGDPRTIEAATLQLGDQIGRELVNAYVASLKLASDVKINQKALEQK